MNQKSMLIALALTFGAFSLATPPVVAAADSHGHVHAPKFGGIVTEGKGFDAELVAKPELLTVHLYDDTKTISAKGAKGKITLLNGADKAEIELVPAGASSMQAKGKFNVSKGTKAVAVITLEGKKPSSVRFVIK